MTSSASPASVQSDRDVRDLQLCSLARDSRDPQPPLSDCGYRFGLVQVTHDPLDERGDAEALGKRIRKDAPRGKLTFFGILGAGENVRRVGLLGNEACDVLTSFGPPADAWRALLQSVFERNR
jgi:hypothetical protein